MAELVHAEKELSDWFPERSEFSYTDCYFAIVGHVGKGS